MVIKKELSVLHIGQCQGCMFEGEENNKDKNFCKIMSRKIYNQ